MADADIEGTPEVAAVPDGPAETPATPLAAAAEPEPTPEVPSAEPEAPEHQPPPQEVIQSKEPPKEQKHEAPPEEEVRHKEKKADLIEKIKPKLGQKEGLDEDVVGMLQGFFGEGITTEEKAVKPIRRPKLIYYNSYRLESRKPFSSEKVTNVIKKTMEEMLDKAKYRSATASDVSLQVAEKIRGRVLAMKFDRYKIVVHVTFGPLNRQGEHIAFRGFWDGKRDSYAFYTFRNARIYCNAIVIGIYFE